MKKTELDSYRAWLQAQKPGGLAPRSVDTYLQKLCAAARVAGADDQDELCAVIQDRERCEQLIADLSERCVPGTVRGYLYALLSFGSYAKQKRLVPFVALFRSDVPPPSAARYVHTYSRPDIELMVSAARADLRWWALLATVADTGRRIGEVLGMEWEHFRLDMQPPHVELPLTKSRKPQYMLLSKRLVEEVFTPEHIDLLWHEERTGRRTFERDPKVYPFPMTYSNAMKRLETHCARLGLPYRGFHNFRHALITERIKRGVPMQAVSALAGHSSPSVTSRYYDQSVALHYGEWVD